MADALPILVKAVTITSGTGTISLSDPSGQESYRTDSEAVDDGSLTSGDTVVYVIRDDTGTAGSGPAAEWGYGTYTRSGSTRTITRTAGNVLDSFDNSSGGAHGGTGGPGVLIDWAASGQRDVYITTAPLDLRKNLSDVADADTAADNINAARTNTANTFTQSQTIQTSAASALLNLYGVKASGTAADIVFQANNGSGSLTTYGRVRSVIVDGLAGSEDGKLQFLVQDNGSEVTHLELLDDGTLQDGSGNEYDHFPAGTKMLFGTAPPAGWTRVNEGTSRTIKVAESGETVGNTGGSQDPFATFSTLGHQLTVSEMPSHSHADGHPSGTGFLVGVSAGATFDSSAGGTANAATTVNTDTTGGDGTHSHSINAIRYTIAAWATKD